MKGESLLRCGIYASLLCAPLTLGFARQYTADWNATRRGLSVEEQRLSLRGVTWFKPAFVDLVDRLQRTLPADAKLLIEPNSIEDYSGAARWFLFFNQYLRPIEVFVRQPARASGCLPDYPVWLEHHLEHPAHLPEERAALLERGIEWRLLYPAAKKLQRERVQLYRRTESGWDLVELAPSSGILERALRSVPHAGQTEALPAAEDGF